MAYVYGLSAGRAWARPVAVLLLWLAIVVGLVQTALAFAGGGILFPLGAIAAALVLRMRPAERSPWPDGHRGPVGTALAIFMFSLALPAAANFLMQPGNSPLSVAPDTLGLTASLECDGVAEQPDRIGVAARWTWTQAELGPHGTDAPAFRWRIDDPGTGEPISPWRFQLADAPGTGFTKTDQGSVYPGREGATGSFWLGTEGASGNVVSDLAQAAEQDGALIEPVMIEVDRQRLADDQFVLTLAPDGPVPIHATLTIDVGYVHAGRWTAWSNSVSCAW